MKYSSFKNVYLEMIYGLFLESETLNLSYARQLALNKLFLYLDSKILETKSLSETLDKIEDLKSIFLKNDVDLSLEGEDVFYKYAFERIQAFKHEDSLALERQYYENRLKRYSLNVDLPEKIKSMDIDPEDTENFNRKNQFLALLSTSIETSSIVLLKNVCGQIEELDRYFEDNYSKITRLSSVTDKTPLKPTFKPEAPSNKTEKNIQAYSEIFSMVAQDAVSEFGLLGVPTFLVFGSLALIVKAIEMTISLFSSPKKEVSKTPQPELPFRNFNSSIHEPHHTSHAPAIC